MERVQPPRAGRVSARSRCCRVIRSVRKLRMLCYLYIIHIEKKIHLPDQNNNKLAKKLACENVEAFADVCGNLAGSRWKRVTGCRK